MNWNYLRHCAWVDTRARFVAGTPAGRRAAGPGLLGRRDAGPHRRAATGSAPLCGRSGGHAGELSCRLPIPAGGSGAGTAALGSGFDGRHHLHAPGGAFARFHLAAARGRAVAQAGRANLLRDPAPEIAHPLQPARPGGGNLHAELLTTTQPTCGRWPWARWPSRRAAWAWKSWPVGSRGTGSLRRLTRYCCFCRPAARNLPLAFIGWAGLPTLSPGRPRVGRGGAAHSGNRTRYQWRGP